MPLIGNTDLVRIDLPVEGEWVEVKRKLSRGDEIAVQKAITKNSRVEASEFSTAFELDGPEAIEAAEFAGLDVAIKAWSFPQPVTPENIRALDADSVEAIKARLNELYEAPRSDAEKKASTVNGSTPSKTRALSPRS